MKTRGNASSTSNTSVTGKRCSRIFANAIEWHGPSGILFNRGFTVLFLTLRFYGTTNFNFGNFNVQGAGTRSSRRECNDLHMQAQSNTTTPDESAHREQESPSAYLPVAQALAPAIPNQPLHVSDCAPRERPPGKKFVLAETGWSSGGSQPKVGVASPANQAKYFSDLFHATRSLNFDFYWYFAFDTDFFSEIANDFGVFYVNGTLKSNFQQLTIRQRDPRAIRNVGSKQLLSENEVNVSMSSKSKDWVVQEQQVWFFDSANQQVRSKSSDRCLDAYQGWDGGIVHLYRCLDGEANQKWALESSTGKLKHVTHKGFCLDTDPAQNNKVQLYGCSPKTMPINSGA
uniref:glucan endo-1,3-beta-D-glucosidase n=1 Tax=Phytophthora fragariae TaxID=53985 RepID=A0A6A3DHV6_9STRA|nr:hypothetical protein PF009_g30423 [Phytophthora fragariae]